MADTRHRDLQKWRVDRTKSLRSLGFNPLEIETILQDELEQRAKLNELMKPQPGPCGGY